MSLAHHVTYITLYGHHVILLAAADWTLLSTSLPLLTTSYNYTLTSKA